MSGVSHPDVLKRLVNYTAAASFSGSIESVAKNGTCVVDVTLTADSEDIFTNAMFITRARCGTHAGNGVFHGLGLFSLFDLYGSAGSYITNSWANEAKVRINNGASAIRVGAYKPSAENNGNCGDFIQYDYCQIVGNALTGKNYFCQNVTDDVFFQQDYSAFIGKTKPISSNYTVTDADSGTKILVGGSTNIVITFPANLKANHEVTLFNGRLDDTTISITFAGSGGNIVLLSDAHTAIKSFGTVRAIKYDDTITFVTGNTK